jgi:hypothetical protein
MSDKTHHEQQLDDAELDQISAGVGLPVSTNDERADSSTAAGGFRSVDGLKYETEVVDYKPGGSRT